MYIPMTMTPDEAKARMEQESVPVSILGAVERALTREELTPLQVQAILVRAWDWALNQGKLTLPTQVGREQIK